MPIYRMYNYSRAINYRSLTLEVTFIRTHVCVRVFVPVANTGTKQAI